jgi:hypothetical protein
MAIFEIKNQVDTEIIVEVFSRTRTFEFSNSDESKALIRFTSEFINELPYSVFKNIYTAQSSLEKLLEFTYFLEDSQTLTVMGVYLGTSHIYINKPVIKYAANNWLGDKRVDRSCLNKEFPIKLDQGQNFSMSLRIDGQRGIFQSEADICVFISDTQGNIYVSDAISARKLI